MNRPTNDQKEKVLNIPDFMGSDDISIATEIDKMNVAILNNVPGNTTIEEQNHLNELERACQNWTPEEWNVVIKHADPEKMLLEVNRQMKAHRDFISNLRSNEQTLASLGV